MTFQTTNASFHLTTKTSHHERPPAVNDVSCIPGLIAYIMHNSNNKT